MRQRRSGGGTRAAWQLHRIRLDPEELHGPRVVLSPANTHHVRQVLRLRPGEQLRGLAPGGHDLILRIQGTGGGRVRCEVEGTMPPLSEPALRVSICQGLTRAERFEFVLQKGAELGAWEFFPVLSARTVVRPDVLRAGARAGRWRRIVEEAALQCGRRHIPGVHPVMNLAELAAILRSEPRDLMLVPYEGEVAPLRDLLKAVRLSRTPSGGSAPSCETGAPAAAAAGPAPLPATAAVVVGPEGGFEAREIELLRDAGFSPVSLGPRILRTETAGPLVLSLLLYEFGDLGGPGVER